MADLKNILAAAESGKLQPVYALVGSEALLNDRAVAALRQATIGDGGIPGFNEDVFHGRETNGASVAAAASTLPMMSDRRFVLVRHVDAMKSNVDALTAYVTEPNPSTCLVMTATKLNGSTKFAKALKKKSYRHDIKPLKGAGLLDFASSEAKRRGHTLGRDAGHALVDAVGDDLAALNDALERLSLYVGAGQRIDANAIQACVTRIRVDTIWALVDAVSLRDRKRALGAASSLLQDREPPLRILAMLARQLRIVARMRDGLGRGLSPENAAKYAGAPPFKARDLKEAARRFRLSDLTRAFSTIAKTDLLLKGSKQPGALALEHAIIQLC